MAKIISFDAFLARRVATLLAFLIGLSDMCAIGETILWLVNVPLLHADAQRVDATVTKLERVLVDLGPDRGPRPGGVPKRALMMWP
jgi:hypothetical protein